MHRLGAVASSLKHGASSVAKNIVFGAPEDDSGAGAEPLLDELTEGVLGADRIAAAEALRRLIEKDERARSFVAERGLVKMFETLRDTNDDDGLVRATLETMRAAASGEASEGRERAREVITGDVNNVKQLVSELRGVDFYSKLHAAQTLSEASETRGDAMRAGVLADPTAVPTLMDAMKENEVIRNEILLLLVSLTRGNEELQKIVAFEGAFERAFAVMREEGGVDGGVVVQDCLELCNNLLRDNPSNQTLFRESGFVRSVPGMAAVEREIGNAGMQGISAQKAANTLCALETVHLLVSPDEESGKRKHLNRDDELDAMMQQQRLQGCRANQSELAKHGTVEILVRAALGDSAVNAVSVRVAALRALAALVRDHEGNQTALFSATADRAGTVTEPALLSCGRAALHSESPAERGAAILVLGAAMLGNPDGQLLLVSTLAPTGLGADDGSEESSLGGLLARALMPKGGSSVAFDQASIAAASVLRDMLHKNDQSKLKALRVNLEPLSSRSNASELLLPRCVRQLAVTHDREEDKEKVEKLQSVLLRLLIVWLYECKAAVEAFLSSPGHLPAIADLARTGGSTESPHVAALACVVLGCCLLENSGSVLDVVSARVGLQNFFMKWEAMTKSSLYADASRAPTLPKPLTRANAAKFATQSEGAEDVSPGGGLYDHDITVFINELEERVKSAIMSLYAKPSGAGGERAVSSVAKREDEDDVSYARRLQEALRASESELAEVRSRNAVLAEQILGVAPTSANASDDPSAVAKNGARHASAEALHAAVEAAKRASAQEIASLTSELEEVKKVAEERQEALTSLSTAYNGLEAEVYRLETEANGLREKLHASSEFGGGAAPETSSLDIAREAGREEGRRLAEAEAELRIRDAVDAALVDADSRLRAAVEAAVADARAADEAELNDLLACLGQEEASKEHLLAKLIAAGESEAALLDELASIVIEDVDA